MDIEHVQKVVDTPDQFEVSVDELVETVADLNAAVCFIVESALEENEEDEKSAVIVLSHCNLGSEYL